MNAIVSTTPRNRGLSIDAVGAILLTATLLSAVVASTPDFAGQPGEAGPTSVAEAFAGYRG